MLSKMTDKHKRSTIIWKSLHINLAASKKLLTMVVTLSWLY